jgi:superfamily II DNA or RNA helicase
MPDPITTSAVAPGARVKDVNSPSRLGTVTSTPPRDRLGGRQWQVLWDNEGRSFEYETGLELVLEDGHGDPIELLRAGQLGTSEDYRRNVTFVHLTGRLANLVYSMGVTNTDFYPHQYRPLLAMLESPCNGLLIADEVGLGKTIEAGLIWTELRARYDKRRLLVVCPAALREKWRDELDIRFGVRASIVTADELVEELTALGDRRRTEEAWIISYQAARPPKGWIDGSTSEVKGAKAKLASLLERGADEPPLFDLVIYDEAHNMRNRETATWRLGNMLREVAEFQIMLSATPINLRNGDLFSLLSLLDPDHFLTTDDLARLIASNAPLIKLRDTILNMRTSRADYLRALSELAGSADFAESAQIKALGDTAPPEEQFPDPAVRSAIADVLERVSLLSRIMVRTRKRDVQPNRIQRIVLKTPVEMSEPERALYDYVTHTIRRYALQRGVNAKFLLAMPQRQVASCPAALLESWLRSLPDDDEEDFRSGYEGMDESDDGRRPLRSKLIANIPPSISIEALRTTDSKYQQLRRLLREAFADNPQDKIIVFTTFRTTARYLCDRLNEDRITAALVWGGSTESKYDTINNFRDSADLRVLISTEVAAEGVDLQFSRALVNYDLPWNPTRVEQRIGRIDRLGQLSSRILVWNLYFNDTIDELIISRLLERLNIFEEALGESEAVVGNLIQQLEYELLSRPRTAEEEVLLVDRTAVALANVAIQRQQLEDNAPLMVAHGASVLQRVNAAQQLARFVGDRDLFSFVCDSLRQHWPGHEFIVDDTDGMIVKLRLGALLSSRLDPYLRERGALGETRLANGGMHQVIFRNSLAPQKRRNLEVIHQFHPLVTFLAADQRSRDLEFYPVVALQVPEAHRPTGLSPGHYVFALMAWSFNGLNEEEWLSPTVLQIEDRVPLSEDHAERLMTATRQFGADWPGARGELDLKEAAELMAEAEEIARALYEQSALRKRAENEDRKRFQLDAIESYFTRRSSKLIEVEERHRRHGRTGLLRATEGLRQALKERMDQKRTNIEAKSEISSAIKFVCGGVIKV